MERPEKCRKVKSHGILKWFQKKWTLAMLECDIAGIFSISRESHDIMVMK